MNQPHIAIITQRVPVTIIFWAPIALAASTVTNPIGPLPRMRTLVPIETLPLLQAWTPTDNGSNNAPSSKDTFFGNLRAKNTRTAIGKHNLHVVTFVFCEICPLEIPHTHPLVTKVRRVHVISTKIAVKRRCGAKFHIWTQIIFAGFAKRTFFTRYTRLYSDSISWKLIYE